MIKVIHIGSAYRPYKGGGALRIANLVESLTKHNDCQIHLITNVADEKGNYSQKRVGNLLVYRCSNTFQMIRSLLKICRKESIDIIHAHNARIGLLCYLLKRKMPLVVEIHGLNQLNYFKKTLARYVFRRCRGIIVLAKAAKEKIAADNQIPLEKIYVLVNGIDIEKFKINRQFSRDQKTVGYLGTFYEWQGVIDFVKAMPLILKKYQNVDFLMLGDGPESTEVIKLVKKLGLGSLVHLPGRVDPQEVPKYLSQMDIFVMPRPSTLATETTIPLKVFEALAAGLPIVASNVGGFADVLTNRKDVLIHQAGDINDLAQKVVTLLKDDGLRNELSKNAVKNPYLNNSWQDVTDKLYRLYKKVILL